jgi:hypothetical protein
MSEQNKPFVVTDRRKFSLDGTPRPDADRAPESSSETREPATQTEPASTSDTPAPAEAHTAISPQAAAPDPEPELALETETDGPPPPTQQEMDQANAAYQQTAERLDTAVRASNPGMDHPPAMTFDAIVQSIFMTTLLQLGATAPEGQQPRIDLMGARQSIDMLGILADKTRGNLSDKETHLLDNALFEVRMGFLEVTQALARSAATRGPAGPGSPGAPGGGSGRPSIVR